MVEAVRERRRKPNPPMANVRASTWYPIKVPSSGPIVGIDASLTNTGFVALYSGCIQPFSLEPKKLRGPERLAWFRKELCALLREFDPGHVMIEGYAFGAKNQREALGELGGVVRLLCYDEEKPYSVVPPTSLKLFVTGNGNGPKDNMSKEIYKRYGVDLTDNNQVDAAGLAIMGLAATGVMELTDFQKRALSKLD